MILFRMISDLAHVFTCLHRNRRLDALICCSHLAYGCGVVMWPELSVQAWLTADKSSFSRMDGWMDPSIHPVVVVVVVPAVAQIGRRKQGCRVPFIEQDGWGGQSGHSRMY